MYNVLMKLYEYGRENEKVLLMLQCAAEPTWIFEPAAQCLSEQYHVFLAGADGHDPSEDSTFTTIENYTDEAVLMLRERGMQKLDALYGVSMGGAAAMYLIAKGDMPVDKAILDAGITPCPYPKWLCRLISWKDFCLIPLAVISPDVLKKVSPPEKWTPEGADPEKHYEKIYDFLKHHFSAQTNYNVFWSANNWHLPENRNLHTKMEYWYGSGEKKARERDIRFVKEHFPQIAIREFNGYGHAQLVIVHPCRFAAEALKSFCRMEQN